MKGSATFVNQVGSDLDGADVTGAILLGGTPLAVLARTDERGIAQIEDASSPMMLVYHEDYQLAEFHSQSNDAHPLWRIRPRPVVSCVLYDVDTEEVAAHRFLVSLESVRDARMVDVGKLVGDSLIPTREWTGFGRCDLHAADSGICKVTVRAYSAVQGIDSEATVSLERLEPYNTVAIRFDRSLGVEPVAVIIHAKFEYVDDTAVCVSISGPIEPESNRPIRGIGRVVEANGFCNRDVVKDAVLLPGKYAWSVTILGVGTFDVGTLHVSKEEREIRLLGKLTFVTGTIGVFGVDRTVDLRAWDGLITVASKVLEKNDARDGYAEWAYMLPKGATLYAMAIARDPWSTSLPVRIPTDRDGGFVAVREWADSELVSFRLQGDAGPAILRCVEVRDELSGMLRTTVMSTDAEHGPMRLTHGVYSARVRKGSRTGEWLGFNIPGSPNVVLPP